MLPVFIFFYALLFLFPLFFKKKAVSFFWIAIILYPHQLFNVIPGGINLYDLYLVLTLIIILWRNKFILKTNEIVFFSFGILILMSFSEFISLIILQKNFNSTIILKQSREIVKLFEYGILALITTNSIRNFQTKEQNLINVFFISIAILSVIGLLQILNINIGNIFYNVDNSDYIENFNRATGSTKGPWIMGALTAFSGIILFNIIIEGPKQNRLLSVILFLITIIGLILTRSRASWLMFVSALPFFLYYSKQKFRFLLITIVILLILVNIPFLYNKILFRILYTFTFGENVLDSSSLTRIMQWKEMLETFEFKYFFTGYGKFSAQEIIGWHTLHNTFLSTLVFNGLMGLLYFCILYYKVLKNLIIVMKYEYDNYLKAIWKGTFIALITLLIYGLTADTFYSFLIMLTFFYFSSIIFERKRKLLYNSAIPTKSKYS